VEDVEVVVVVVVDPLAQKVLVEDAEANAEAEAVELDVAEAVAEAVGELDVAEEAVVENLQLILHVSPSMLEPEDADAEEAVVENLNTNRVEPEDAEANALNVHKLYVNNYAKH